MAARTITAPRKLAQRLAPHLAALLLASLALPGCSEQSREQRYELDGARIGGAFTLVGEDGGAVRWSDFAGKYRLVYFGYTYCPDVCPLDLSKITAGFRLLEKSDPATAAKIQPIFITVDPQRDTPAVVKTYTDAFHPRLLGLTGSPAEIERVKTLFVVVASKKGDPKARQDYLVSHSRTPFLFDPEGRPVALVPVDDTQTEADEATPEIMRDFLAKWVR
jgi:protein SCO1